MVPDSTSQYVVVARVADAFGIKGQVKVRSFTEKPENILQYSAWVLEKKPAGRQSFDLVSGQLHGKLVTARLAGINSRDEALDLKGADVLIPRAELPQLPEGQYYHFQLLGLEVVDIDGQRYGQVEDVMQTGANDVLVIKGEKTHLMPYIPDVIVEVDLDRAIIRADWYAEL